MGFRTTALLAIALLASAAVWLTRGHDRDRVSEVMVPRVARAVEPGVVGPPPRPVDAGVPSPPLARVAVPPVHAPARSAQLVVDAPTQSEIGGLVELQVRLEVNELPQRLTFDVEFDPAVFRFHNVEKGDFIDLSSGPMLFAADEVGDGRVTISATVAPDALLRQRGTVAVIQLEPLVRATTTIRIHPGTFVPRADLARVIATPGVDHRVTVF